MIAPAPPDDVSPAALEAFVASVRHVPLFTATALQLLRSVDDETVGAGELGRLIAADAGLAAHLLRIVNSPYYGIPRRIGTVGDALAVLGFDLVRRMVTAAVLQRPIHTWLRDGAMAREFWRHGLQCAALARHLARGQGRDGEAAYMAGLLHDVGRLVMLGRFADQADLLLERRGEDHREDLARERSLFGFDHAQVGGALLELWGLPASLVQATHQHADEIEPDEPAAVGVWRANRVAHAMADEGAANEDATGPSPWMDDIGLTVEARRQIDDEIAALEHEQA